uniref:Uncharacterized protein n=1 Tax=Glossina austeni TaxID=7395 RepID=A0A1A9V7E2_GLOAU
MIPIMADVLIIVACVWRRQITTSIDAGGFEEICIVFELNPARKNTKNMMFCGLYLGSWDVNKGPNFSMAQDCTIILYLDFLNGLGVFESIPNFLQKFLIRDFLAFLQVEFSKAYPNSVKDKTVLNRLTLKPSSRFHLIEGSGLPFALHLKVTLSPSRIITSLDVKASSIFGGTVQKI